MSIEFLFFFKKKSISRKRIYGSSYNDDAMSTQKKTVLSKLFYRPYFSGKIMNHNLVLLDFFVCVSIERRTTEWNADDSTAINNFVGKNVNETIQTCLSFNGVDSFALLLENEQRFSFKQFFISMKLQLKSHKENDFQIIIRANQQLNWFWKSDEMVWSGHQNYTAQNKFNGNVFQRFYMQSFG